MAKFTVISANPEMKDMLYLHNDVEYACPDGDRLAMQIIVPVWKPEGAGFPLVVFVQGSAWTKPNQFWQLPQLSILARRGYVIASVTHRSAFTAKAPAFLQDVKTAIRFLRANAETYKIDKNRVGVWGTSSGGNTALLVGVTGDDPAFELSDWAGESSSVKCVVDCFGPTDVTKMVNEHFENGAFSDMYEIIFALGGSRETEACNAALNEINPMRYIKPGCDLPPFMILHGDADELVPYRYSEMMYDRLEECGCDVEMVRVTGAPHEDSFWSMQLLEMIFDFIRRKL